MVARPALLLLLGLSACGGPPRPRTVAFQAPPAPVDEHLPSYVKRPPEPFSRLNTIAVAEREWRAFGSVIDDRPPGMPLPRDLRPDQQPGLWQRVGDYWWASQDFGAKEGSWDSRYTENGTVYETTGPAWSAAFISYVMRVAGAGSAFPYTPLHADYINAAARNEGALVAERPETYPPQPGDLICVGRASARNLRFDDLPAPRFFAHCDLVVRAEPGQVAVIGGNVAGGVTMKHVPVMPQGTLAGADGRVVDERYPWFVVLRVRYEAPLS